jgi:phospholipase/carboxylesterase
MYTTRGIEVDQCWEEGFYASTVDCPLRLPVLTFLPGGYEPNYAYPLILFFHGDGSSERRILRLAPRLSRRNYICAALRGPQVVMRHGDGSLGYSWQEGASADAVAEEYVFEAIKQIGDRYHVHWQRIFLAGFCEGAAMAFRLGLSYPRNFAGIIAMNGQIPLATPLFQWPDTRRLRILLGHGIANAVIPLSAARRAHRLFYTAGLDVQFRTYPTTHRIHADMLRDMNRWIMQGVTGN